MSPRFPFTPFPTGWFRVAASQDLGRCDVRALQYFGQDLVLYRGEDGVPRLLDAYCPHLGAHLGLGRPSPGYDVRWDAPPVELNPAVKAFQELTVRKWQAYLVDSANDKGASDTGADDARADNEAVRRLASGDD
jgi:hypothetical protein